MALGNTICRGIKVWRSLFVPGALIPFHISMASFTNIVTVVTDLFKYPSGPSSPHEQTESSAYARSDSGTIYNYSDGTFVLSQVEWNIKLTASIWRFHIGFIHSIQIFSPCKNYLLHRIYTTLTFTICRPSLRTNLHHHAHHIHGSFHIDHSASIRRQRIVECWFANSCFDFDFLQFIPGPM